MRARQPRPGVDHWVICPDYVDGPYTREAALGRAAKSDRSICPHGGHAVVQAATEPELPWQREEDV